MPYSTEHPFGQLGWVVPAVSPPAPPAPGSVRTCKVPDWVATTENISTISTLFSSQIRNTALHQPAEKKINSIPAKTRTRGHICPESSWVRTSSVSGCQVLQGFLGHLPPPTALAGQWKCSAGGNWGYPYRHMRKGKQRSHAEQTIAHGICGTEGKTPASDHQKCHQYCQRVKEHRRCGHQRSGPVTEFTNVIFASIFYPKNTTNFIPLTFYQT